MGNCNLWNVSLSWSGLDWCVSHAGIRISYGMSSWLSSKGLWFDAPMYENLFFSVYLFIYIVWLLSLTRRKSGVLPIDWDRILCVTCWLLLQTKKQMLYNLVHLQEQHSESNWDGGGRCEQPYWSVHNHFTTPSHHFHSCYVS